jgi:hypothetical protein
MENNKQTAVEWLIDKVDKHLIHLSMGQIFEQAKEMEKQQIEDAHIEGQRVFDKYPHTEWTNNQAEIYYEKNYGKNINDNTIL